MSPDLRSCLGHYRGTGEVRTSLWKLELPGGHTGISSIPIFTFPSHAHVSQLWAHWCFPWAEWDETPMGQHCLAAPVSRRWIRVSMLCVSASPCSCTLALSLNFHSWKAGAQRVPLLEAAAEHTQVGKCQQGNPEWRFCLWGDEETPLSELKCSPSQAGFGVSHPPAGPCSSPAVASPGCVGSREGAVLAFPPLFQDFNFYFRLINFLSSWR